MLVLNSTFFMPCPSTRSLTSFSSLVHSPTTQFILSFSFCFGSAASKMFEGILLILVQKVSVDMPSFFFGYFIA